MIQNPILKGFNPDPSICRVDDGFLVATSTFEWFPGVQIWASDDLRTWRLRTRPLDEPRLLDMSGVQSSGGVWAPCLSYRDGVFYLVFTVVRTWRGHPGMDIGAFKDTLNYVVSAESIDGPWSDPVFVNASGFDPSLFHDDDGRSWFLNMEWDYRGESSYFSGILLQEFDREKRRPLGPIHKIFRGTELDCVEGPHVYRRNGWYYLLTAEGGTSYKHAVTVARSRLLTGPYEVHPANPMLSSLADRTRDMEAIDTLRHSPVSDRLFDSAPEGFYSRPQKAGHASMCRLTDDDWALVHLSGRPLPGSASCPLGRETSIQRVKWEGDWPFVVDSDDSISPLALPEITISIPPESPKQDTPEGPSRTYTNHDTLVMDDFSGPNLHPALRFLRRHPGEDVSLSARRGSLRLIGRESPVSPFRQTIVAMAVTGFRYRVDVEVDFSPDSFQQMAGLMVRYDERNQYYLRITGSKGGGRTLGMIRFIGGKLHLSEETELASGPLTLSLAVDGRDGVFSWSMDGRITAIPEVLDMLKLSDESPWPEGFTGTFAGMACHDMTGRAIHADFRHFSYREQAL